MSFFGPTILSYLGVDIGSSSIKMVELKKVQNKVALVGYGFSDKLASNYSDLNHLDIKAITTVIESIVRKANFSSAHNVVASLPTFTVFSSIITLSGKILEKDLDSSVAWEAKKVIPLPLQDIVIHWQKINDSKSNVNKFAAKASATQAPVAAQAAQGNTTSPTAVTAATTPNNYKILLIGAPKNLTKSYAYAFKSMNFNLISLETEIFGLIRSLIGPDKITTMIVQAGASSTNIFVIDAGVPVLSRSIDVGGLAVTKAIAKSLQMDLEKAEQFKYDLASHSDGTIPKMITDTLAPVFNEIRYISEIYATKENNEIKKIILTGGSALLYGLPEYIQNLTNINTVVGDPWFRVSYPAELKPVLEQIGPRMAVAIGLAMYEYDKA